MSELVRYQLGGSKYNVHTVPLSELRLVAEVTLRSLSSSLPDVDKLYEMRGGSFLLLHQKPLKEAAASTQAYPSVRIHEAEILSPDEAAGWLCWRGFDDRAAEIGAKLGEGRNGKGQVKPTKSTTPGDAREKLITALSAHHEYDEGTCMNTTPIGCRVLAQAAEVAVGTASEFFKQEFGSHRIYKRQCNDVSSLVGAIKLLRGEMSPSILYKSLDHDHGDVDDTDDE